MEKSHLMMRQKTKRLSEESLLTASSTDDSEVDFDVETLYSEKTNEQKAVIDQLLQSCAQFHNITEAQRELIHKVITPMQVTKGQRIIQQGDKGDCMYIVEDGLFEVKILAKGQTGEGVAIMEYEGSPDNNAHPSFGELALLYSNPRAASVVAMRDGRLWSLHRYAFKKIAAEQGARKDAEAVLRQVKEFRSLKPGQLTDLAAYLIEVKYGPGDVVTTQGEVGDALFILRPGAKCESVKKNADGSLTTSALTENLYFGAEVLTGETRYLATVTATDKTKCWMLHASDVKKAVGSKWKKIDLKRIVSMGV